MILIKLRLLNSKLNFSKYTLKSLFGDLFMVMIKIEYEIRKRKTAPVYFMSNQTLLPIIIKVIDNKKWYTSWISVGCGF